MQSLDAQVVTQALEWARGGDTVWYCTVLSTFGSSPREPGSIMVANASGDHVGSLSGGCVEEDFLARVVAGEYTMPAVIVRYGAPGSGDGHPQVRLPCGGILDVLVERREATSANVQHFEQLSAALAGEQELLRRVSLADGAASLAPASAGGPRVCYEAHGGERSPARGARSQTHSRRILLGGRRLRALRPAVGVSGRAMRSSGGGHGQCRVARGDDVRSPIAVPVHCPAGDVYVVDRRGGRDPRSANRRPGHDGSGQNPGELHWRHGFSTNLPGQGRAPAPDWRAERGGDRAYPYAHRPRFGQQDTGGNRLGDHGGRSSRATRARLGR